MTKTEKAAVSAAAALVFTVGSAGYNGGIAMKQGAFLPSQAVCIEEMESDLPVIVISGKEKPKIAFRIAELVQEICNCTTHRTDLD